MSIIVSTTCMLQENRVLYHLLSLFALVQTLLWGANVFCSTDSGNELNVIWYDLCCSNWCNSAPLCVCVWRKNISDFGDQHLWWVNDAPAQKQLIERHIAGDVKLVSRQISRAPDSEGSSESPVFTQSWTGFTSFGDGEQSWAEKLIEADRSW